MTQQIQGAEDARTQRAATGQKALAGGPGHFTAPVPKADLNTPHEALELHPQGADTSPTEELAGRIRELRHARHWNQAQLARETGLSRAYIKALEDGNSKEPSARTIGRLCLAFQTDPIELMQTCGALPPDFREGQFREDLDMVMYLRRQRKLSEAFVNTLMRLIRLAERDEHGPDK